MDESIIFLQYNWFLLVHRAQSRCWFHIANPVEACFDIVNADLARFECDHADLLVFWDEKFIDFFAFCSLKCEGCELGSVLFTKLENSNCAPIVTN